MKAVIVFYSLGGVTQACTQALAERLGADLFRLEETRPRKKGTSLFVYGGMQATFGLRSKLKAQPDLSHADVVVFGMPVWASATPPAINAALAKCKLSGKSVYAFVTKADPSAEAPEKAKARLEKMVAAKGGRLLEIFALPVKMGETLAASDAVAKTAPWAVRIQTGK